MGFFERMYRIMENNNVKLDDKDVTIKYRSGKVLFTKDDEGVISVKVTDDTDGIKEYTFDSIESLRKGTY